LEKAVHGRESPTGAAEHKASLVWFVIAMALWSRLSQCLVWEKLVTKIADIHPLEPDAQLSDSALSGRRAALGYTGLQELMQARCVVIANPDQMPSAFLVDIG